MSDRERIPCFAQFILGGVRTLFPKSMQLGLNNGVKSRSLLRTYRDKQTDPLWPTYSKAPSVVVTWGWGSYVLKADLGNNAPLWHSDAVLGGATIPLTPTRSVHTLQTRSYKSWQFQHEKYCCYLNLQHHVCNHYPVRSTSSLLF